MYEVALSVLLYHQYILYYDMWWDYFSSILLLASTNDSFQNQLPLWQLLYGVSPISSFLLHLWRGICRSTLAYLLLTSWFLSVWTRRFWVDNECLLRTTGLRMQIELHEVDGMEFSCHGYHLQTCRKQSSLQCEGVPRGFLGAHPPLALWRGVSLSLPIISHLECRWA